MAALGGTDGKKELTKQESRQLTNARNLAANALYELTVDLIEAARRAYPSTRASEENVIKARGLFLTDTFSPNPRRAGSGSAEPCGRIVNCGYVTLSVSPPPDPTSAQQMYIVHT